MKKSLFLAAVAVAALCGCQKEAPKVTEFQNGETPILFGAYTNVPNKSAIIDQTSVETNGIGVFAFSQEQDKLESFSKTNYQPNFMFNQQVTFDGTNWAYSPIKYWPNNPGAMVSFFAYAPYTAGFSQDEHIITPDTNTYLHTVSPVDPDGTCLTLGYDTNGPAITYNMPADPTAGVDLMWGAWMKSGAEQTTSPYDLTKQAIGDKVEFKMKHALSRLGFDLQVVVDEVAPSNPSQALAPETTINVKRVTLKGNFASKGTLRLYDGNWKIANTDIKEIEFTNGDGTAANSDFNAVIANGIINNEAVSPIALLKSSVAGDNYVMAIPGVSFYIEIEYDVVTVDAANPKNNSTVTNIIRSTDTNSEGPTNGQYTLNQGYAYMFHLRLGMTSVKFNVTAVEAWTDAPETDVDLPENFA